MVNLHSSKNIGTIRTGLPAAWATFITWAIAKFGLDIDENDYAVMMIVLPLVIPTFYRIAREVEQKYPRVGKLIFGSGTAPTYEEENVEEVES